MKKNKLPILFFLVALLFHSLSSATRIGFSSETWKTIRTEHFDIIFSAEQQDLGLYYANIAEVAYENLTTVFTNKPDRLVIILNDTTDISNGYATRIPYAHIMAFTVPIGDHKSLSESGEWARELITHELTHILQLEPGLGFYRFLRPVFGTIVAPNLLTPLWWKEGMAVEMETQFSPQGRSRSKFQDATIRALVLDRKLFEYSLASANEVLPTWPYGGRPYLFGSLFFSSLVKDTNISSVNSIVSRQGERAPYFIEEPMQEVAGRNYESQYNRALYEAEQNSQVQIEKIQTQPVSEFVQLKTKGQSSYYPRWSETFKILAYIENVEAESEVSFVNEKFEKINFKKRPRGTITSLSFHPIEKKLAYSKVDRPNSKYQMSDIYVYDLNLEKSDQITFNQRARDLSFSDDGKKIIFVATFKGQTQIKILNLADRKIELIASSGFKARFQSPLFWSENEILYSKRDENGIQSLFQMNLTDKKEVKLNLNYADSRFLRKVVRNSKSTLYFSSSENGVHNIYMTEDFKKVSPVTNAINGLWSYDINPTENKIWATEMTSHGFNVGVTDLKIREKDLPIIENKLANRYVFKKNTREDKTYPSEEYSAVEYLIPTYWIPYIASSSSSRGVFFQAQTSGHDPLNIHEYSLLGSYESDLQKFAFAGIYTNSAFTLPFQVGALVNNQAFGDINSIVETKTTYLGILPDLFSLNKNLLFQTGFEFNETNYFSSQTQHWGPYAQIIYHDYSQNIFQISPEKGWGAYLKYENNQNVKNSREYNKVLASAIGYFSNWLPKHHAIMARTSALLTFEGVPARFGTSSESLFMNSDLILPQFVLRGYMPNQFYGRSLWNFNTEYRFPLIRIEKGSGTDAYFLKRLSGAVIFDGLGVEGGSLTEKNNYEKLALNESFWSSGLEIKLETTVGYVLPLNFVLGFYVPHSPLYSSQTQTGLSIQIGGF
jgi:hypothetical protein